MHVTPLRKVFSPSIFEIISYSFLTLGIMIAVNMQAIINQFTGSIPLSDRAFQHSVGNQLLNISDNTIVSHMTVVLFWGMVGLVTYTVFWLGLNFAISLKNEVVVEADYVNKASFADRIRVPLEQLFIGGFLLLYVVFSLKVLYPLWISLSHLFFQNINVVDPQLVLQLWICLMGSWLTLYIGWALAKLIFAVRD